MAVMKLLCRHGANPNVANHRGETTLHKAARSENGLEAVRLLCSYDADLNARAKEKNIALHEAAAFGPLEIVLFRTSQDESGMLFLNAWGQTPRRLAEERGRTKVAQWLYDQEYHGRDDFITRFRDRKYRKQAKQGELYSI